ncbi:terminase gpA endonuclease subunit [Anaerotignum sp.]|uniref:terminase gpA endonuclease subunit n=1 Tax=Anaerotignum sp. TaxID=2039241 RepID=UPI0028AE0E2B|nr:terminase gpA endonuclease subunit [Anaerotignum sp.]
MPTADKNRSRQRTRNLFVSVLKKSLRKPEKLTVSAWAEKYRILDESSNFKGRWSNMITPYLIGVMDSFNDPYIQEINFVKPTQVGGTEAMINMLGYIIMQSPAPTMVVYPTDDLAKDISRDKLQPSLMKTKAIEEKFRKNESKELALKFYGMNMYLRGAGSPSKLASKSIKYLFFDEIDKVGGASKKEASPYNLAKERTRTFTFSKKIFTTSTPTLKTNYVWMLHESADEQRQYYVQCPHCGKWITLVFKQIIFPNGEEKISTTDRAKEAVYRCQECDEIITDKEKYQIIQQGEWRTVNKTCSGRARSVSFWLNALYSRFLTWEEIVLEFLNSKDDPERLQNFVNSWLAEPWENTKLKTSEDLVMECQTEYEEMVVPDWAKLLTGGIDVQENCIYWTIRAWGDFMTSQNIAHGQALSMEEAERIMGIPYRKRNGEGYLVSLALMDSGDQTDQVYDFCVKNTEWVLPCKGRPPMLSNYKLSTINKAGSTANGMTLVLIDVGKYKDMIAARMQRKKGEGAWMVYQGCDMDYACQVTSEHKITERGKGQITQIWVKKTTHADNHYLDTEVYAAAAAEIMGVRSLFLYGEEQEETTEKPVETQQEESWISGSDNWI